MPEIEFVEPEPVPGGDDELFAGARHRRARPGRDSRLAWATALAVVVAGIVVVLTRPGDRQPVAAPPSSSPSSSSSVESDSVSVPPGPGLPSAEYTESLTLPDCAGLPVTRCRFDLAAPGDVFLAIRTHLGAVTHLRVATVLPTGASKAVRRRTVASQAGEDNVQIDVRPAAAGQRARSGTSYVGAFATVYATELQHGLAVTVSASGPQTQTPSVVSVSALAADPRLLAVG